MIQKNRVAFQKGILICMVLFSLLSCFREEEQTTIQQDLKVGMLISVGGVGDRSFNDSALKGLKAVQEEFGAVTRFVDYRSESKNLENLRIFAEEKFDLIIGIGFYNLAAIETAAKEFPESRFVIIDIPSGMANVYSAIFEEEEASFLVGALAAIQSQNQKIGFLGGADIPVVDAIRRGYEAGALYVNSNIEVVTHMAGSFDDPDKGYELAEVMYLGGCDIVYSGAGKTGVGAIGSAKKYNRFFIGTDTDQCSIGPENVLASRMKNLDVVIHDLVTQYVDGRFLPGTISYGLKQNGLSLIVNESLLSSEDLLAYRAIEADLLNGKIDTDHLLAMTK